MGACLLAVNAVSMGLLGLSMLDKYENTPEGSRMETAVWFLEFVAFCSKFLRGLQHILCVA